MRREAPLTAPISSAVLRFVFLLSVAINSDTGRGSDGGSSQTKQESQAPNVNLGLLPRAQSIKNTIDYNASGCRLIWRNLFLNLWYQSASGHIF
jgi:hypothetical protein